jgi:hypothetical protein
MVRVALIVVAIAAGAFVLNLFLFDAADSTGSAGRLSPRADDPPARVLSTGTGSGAGTTAPGDDRGRQGATTTSRATTTSSGGGTTTSDDHGSGHSSGGGSGSDDGGSGRGRGRGGADD